MTWHEFSDDEGGLEVFETLAHWVGSDVGTMARACAGLSPYRLSKEALDSVREPRQTKRELGEPVDLDTWDVIATEHLPVVIRYRPGTIEVWRITFDWEGHGHRVLQMVGEPVVIDTELDGAHEAAQRFLKAIAVQRTKQARRSTICTWCGQLMVKGERYSTYCCYGCATSVKGVVF